MSRPTERASDEWTQQGIIKINTNTSQLMKALYPDEDCRVTVEVADWRLRRVGKAYPSHEVDSELGKTLSDMVRICPDCLQYYPMTPAYWPRNRDGAFGLYSKCRECKRSDTHKWRQKRRNY